MARLFIGTSGWDYPHWSGGVFYPKGLSQGRWLEYYTKFFNSVELNVTFYRLVRKQTFQNWHKRTPKNFYFVAKGSRFITHIKKLTAAKESLGLFIDNARELKEKLLAVLWQLPPSFRKDLGRLETFLNLLKKTRVRHVFEFRNQTWFDKEVYALLKKYNACLCIAHSSRFPCVKEITSDFLYLRFHGAESLYGSNYSDKELKEWANFAKGFSAEGGSAYGGRNKPRTCAQVRGKDILTFFNNDAQGLAVRNASRFRELLEMK